MDIDTPIAEEPSTQFWRPLEPNQRRVLGVLIEKAKTTPDGYPLSLSALRAGCNQKNNRSPLMQLEEPQIEEALDGLRQIGAMAVVQGSGRVDRYRHLAYEWLGVEKVELAVMAELLLRGAQSVGELRGRAARMEPIKDLGELQPTLDALQAKGLIQYLTPPGRGSIVTHALYLEREMEKVRRDAGTGHASPTSTVRQAGVEPPAFGAQSDEINLLRDELAAVKRDLESVRTEFTATAKELRRELERLSRRGE